MTNSEKTRTARFPKELWEVIDQDAKQCKRNWNQQIEMILSLYYGLEENLADINSKKIIQLRSGASKQNNGAKDNLMQTIEFGQKAEANDNQIDEDSIIYQGKAIYRKK